MPMPLVLVVLFALVGSLAAQESWSTMVHNGDDANLPWRGVVGDRQIAIAGDAVYVVWSASDPIWPIQWVRSLDRGATWSVPAALPVVGQTGGLFSSSMCVHASGGDVVVVRPCWAWPMGHIEAAASHDFGLTWTVQPVLGSTDFDSITAEGTSIVVGGASGVVASTDMGRTWSVSRPLAHAGLNSGPVEGVMHLRLAAGVLHAAWTERTGTAVSDGYYNCSADLGVQWRTVDRRVSTAPGWGSAIQTLVADGAKVFLAWRETTGTRCDRSLDSGNTWLPNPQLLPVGTNCWFHSLLLDGANLLAVFETSYPNYTVYGARSQDLGASWQGGSSPMLTFSNAIRFLHITGTFGGSGLMALSLVGQDRQWLPYTNVGYSLVSPDGGVAWTGFTGSASQTAAFFGALGPNHVADHGALFGIWTMDPGWMMPGRRVGAGWLAGPRSLGGASPGAQGIAPALVMDRVPVLGFDYELHLRDGRAGAPAVVAFGPRRASGPMLGGSLMVDPHAYYFLQLGGPGAGQGTAMMRFRVPQYSALMEYACQAFVLDPAAAHGVAMSAGIEVRLL